MPRKQYTIHYIYKITCNITKKYYIGMHSTFKLKDGYFGSGKRLWYSIKKHGKKNHTKEILEFFPDRISLIEREKQIVNEELLNDKLCMNLMVGGEGGFISDENQRYRSSCGGKANALKLKTDLEFRKKFGEHSRRTIIKTYEKGKLNHNRNTFEGKKHSEETKKKISNNRKGKGIGKRNSQYGTCWIYNIQLKKEKKIKKKDLKYWLGLGWISGRITSRYASG